ncbi:hypothetical protein MRX96_039651 [Rhipicephalus microplus]
MQPSFQAGKQAAAYRDPAGRRPVYAANPRKQQQGTFPARLGSPPASSINSGGSAGGSSSSGSQGDQLSKTNLYIKGLTHTTTDKDLLNLCAPMESKEKCEQIIATFNGKVLAGSKEPLLVKFADGGNKKRTLYKNHEHRMWRDGEGLPYEQGALSQNGVGQPLVPAPLGGYQPAQQRGYSAAATPTAYALHGGAWMQPAQYIMQAPHLATTPQMLQSSLEPLAHAYSPMLPQLTAQMNQLSIPGASYMAAAGAHPYGSPAPTLYQQAPQLVQQIPLSEDPSNGGLGNGEDTTPYQGYPK